MRREDAFSNKRFNRSPQSRNFPRKLRCAAGITINWQKGASADGRGRRTWGFQSLNEGGVRVIHRRDKLDNGLEPRAPVCAKSAIQTLGVLRVFRITASSPSSRLA